MIIITGEPDYQKITISYLRDFILDNNVRENDSIALDQKMFDELALNFRETYKEHIKIPFIFLGVWIKVSKENRHRLRAPLITKDDPRLSETSSAKEELVTWGQVERCQNCGMLLDSNGNKLQGYAYELAVKRWKTYDTSIFLPTIGKCCEYLRYQ